MSARPITTGETAKGRSMAAFSNAFPRKVWRTRTSAQSTPKIVFSGTAIATISSVSQKACWASGVVIDSQNALTPCSKAR